MAGAVLGIDPGPEQSAYCFYRPGGHREVTTQLLPNDELRLVLCEANTFAGCTLAVEMVESFGMPVGRETFYTCFWVGRLVEAWGREHILLGRQEIKLHLCHSPKANDATVRQALIDRFGGSTALAKSKKCARCRGTGSVLFKKCPGTTAVCPKCDGSGRLGTDGVLAGVSSHGWSALAVAVTFWDTKREQP